MLDLFPPVIDGTLREHYILLFGSAGLFAMVVGGVSAWIGAYVGARRASRRLAEQLGRGEGAALTEARVAMLLQGMVAIAVEVERISESQRFTTRVLTERGGGVPAPAPTGTMPRAARDPRSITPH